uniref:F-box domain-containing protein n=1 Tax=Acrobeloides nanus TaxID=290746 RepID=A0A914BU91_9BILA
MSRKRKNQILNEPPAKLANIEECRLKYMVGEMVLCKSEIDNFFYEAKITAITKSEEGEFFYKVHFKGWKAKYDENVPDSETEFRFKYHTIGNVQNAQEEIKLAKMRKKVGVITNSETLPKQLNMKKLSKFTKMITPDLPPIVIPANSGTCAELPDDILVNIFKYLRREDIDNCRLVCSKWNQAIEKAAYRLPACKIHSVCFNAERDKSIMFKSFSGCFVRFSNLDKDLWQPTRFIFKTSSLESFRIVALSDFPLVDKLQRITKLTNGRIRTDKLVLDIGETIALKWLNKLPQIVQEYISTPNVHLKLLPLTFAYLLTHPEMIYFCPNTQVNIRVKIGSRKGANWIEKNRNALVYFLLGTTVRCAPRYFLDIYLMEIDACLIIEPIVKAFLIIDEPSLFFKQIEIFHDREEISYLKEYGFVLNRSHGQRQIHHLKRPQNDWILEADFHVFDGTIYSMRLSPICVVNENYPY